MLDIVRQLAKVMKETNHSGITKPSKFSDADHHWDEWNYQLRSYLEAKGWLQTYDHPTGPRTAGFDTDINKKLYNKLTMLCTKGTAITYLRKAAELDGWGAGKKLRLRYHGFSKQRGKTLRNTVENLRHVHGTNITKHIDLFEKIITQMSHNDPLHPPTEEQRIDWFIDSVTERTYDAVQATCLEGNIDGTLIFNKMVKLFTHKCFQRYPEFQIKELVASSSNAIVTNNSTTTYDQRGKNHRDKGKGRGKESSHHGPKGNRNPNGPKKGKGEKGKQNGKGKSQRPTTGNRNSDPCSYCGKPGHQNRDCRKRQYDEKQKSKPTHNNNSQYAHPIQVDAMMFTQHVLFAHPHATDNTDPAQVVIDTDTEQQETVTDNAHETADTDSDTQDDPTPDWTVPPASTFLRFYFDEPGYLNTKTESEVSTTDTVLTAPEEPTSLLVVPPPGSTNGHPEHSLNPSRSLTENEGSSAVSQPNLDTPQWGQCRQEVPSLNLWNASPNPPQQLNYLHRSCSICEKHMVTLNPFKTLTCHDCQQ